MRVSCNTSQRFVIVSYTTIVCSEIFRNDYTAMIEQCNSSSSRLKKNLKISFQEGTELNLTSLLLNFFIKVNGIRLFMLDRMRDILLAIILAVQLEILRAAMKAVVLVFDNKFDTIFHAWFYACSL